MKTRIGWVSNSSSSSFILIGQDSGDLFDIENREVEKKMMNELKNFDLLEDQYMQPGQILVGYIFGAELDEFEEYDIEEIEDKIKGVKEQLLQLCKNMNVESPEDKIKIKLYNCVCVDN